MARAKALPRVLITRDVANGIIDITAPFDEDGSRRHILKSFGCRWMKDTKTWQCSVGRLEPLTAHLRHYGDQVIVTDVWTPPPTARLYAVSTGGDWAESMFSALSPELAEKAYRALSRVLHPDAGGDVRAQQQLNDAWSRMRPRAGAR